MTGMDDIAPPAAPEMAPAGFLPINPFGADSNLASRIAGLGGDRAPDDPGYTFRSSDIFPSPGLARFELHLHDLSARFGTLALRVEARSIYPGTAPIVVKDIAMPIAAVVAANGRAAISFVARRNMAYIVSGRIGDETDAWGSAASLSLYPRPSEATPLDDRPVPIPPAPPERPSGAVRVGRPELVTADPPLLSAPVSQAMTIAQLRDPLLNAWADALGDEPGDDAARWGDAAVLQALHHYSGGAALVGGRVLGIAAEPRSLPAYLAGRGATVLIAAPARRDLPEVDPGLLLEQVARPALCAPAHFFAAVHATALTDLVLPSGLAGFDALWSADAAATGGDRVHLAAMMRVAMACLRPGGLAVHVLRYSGELAPSADPHSASHGRVEIERLALSLIADGHDVAPLAFTINDGDESGTDPCLPFVLITRRRD
ncbi:hypothetical protein [Sphingomonas bacterium]|uniref:hypothetical protein n=1 Tax=Sphingomonas bacterium TaxID=1895847 RepID=UPI001575B15B|nr:hypothetical protein [Sphingomonas bacterium]